MLSVAVAMIAVLLLAGCAAGPLYTIQKGGVGGTYLATVHFGTRQQVAEWCGVVDAYACVRPYGVSKGIVRVEAAFPQDNTPPVRLEAAVHELCHALAQAQIDQLGRDPCHDEDHGRLHDLR